MELELAVEDTSIVFGDDSAGEDDSESLKPQVFVLSSGEITPEFELQFFYPMLLTRYAVRASFDGKHSTALVE